MTNFRLLRQPNLIFSVVTLERIMVLAFLLLWIVWPLRNTIAARNIALVIGATSALIFLGVNRCRFKFLDLFPIYLLLCVPAWLIILYIFHPIEPNLQWADISGTWVRVLLGMIFAVGLSKMIISKPKYEKIYCCALFIWPACIAFVFIYQGLFTATWFGEHIYIRILKSKVSGAYFLMWSLTFCFAIFYSFVIDKNHRFCTDQWGVVDR